MRRFVWSFVVLGALVTGARAEEEADDNGELTFSAVIEGHASASELWSAEPDGTNARRFLQQEFGPIISMYAPSWSHDGQRLAFLSKGTALASLPIFLNVTDAAGSTPWTPLTTLPRGNLIDSRPTWSPDGKKIAYSEADGIHVIDVLSKTSTLLLANTETIQYDQPSWSPDGVRIAARATESPIGIYGIERDIVVFPVAGGTPANLTRDGFAGRDCGWPDWSPDGRRIVCHRGLQQKPGIGGDGLPGPLPSVLLVVDAQSGAVTEVPQTPSHYYPAWSPDGFQFVSGSPGAVTVQNTDGTGRRVLTGNCQGCLQGGVPADWRPVVKADIDLQIADGSARELGGLFLPDEANAKKLPALDWGVTRAVKGVAADGVQLLLVRANVRDKKAASVRFRVRENQFNAAPGSFWNADDATLIDATPAGGERDQMPPGPSELIVAPVKNPVLKAERVAFALYRAPRDFDGAFGTVARQTRPVTLGADLLDGNGAVTATYDVRLEIVRPLVILQHGTFDSPNGWVNSPLFTQTGNELKDYLGFTALYPFQTDRGDFSSVLGACGPLVQSAPVAWDTLVLKLENWRRVTGFAGAQADVVCHSYGGVNMRWAAQRQADASPVALNVRNNFRNHANWGHGAFHKLITIASTHRGSAVSNQLAYVNHAGFVRGAIRLAASVEKSWIDRGGVEDQMVLSPILRQMPQTRVPGHAIAGSGLARFNAGYEARFAKVFNVDIAGGPFNVLGPLYTKDGQGNDVPDHAAFKRVSDYVFNIASTLKDDTTQDPNYDLTVSSYSSKAGMPLRAQSTPQTLGDAVGQDLAGRLTHGDQIAPGSGDQTPMTAVALRVAFLLRLPTTAPEFAFFPAVLDAGVSPTEADFSNPQFFDPSWLYEGVIAKKADGLAATLTVAPPGPAVAPGQVLTVTVEWPQAEIQTGFLAWPGLPGDEGGGFATMRPGVNVVTVTVPDRRPGSFPIGAVLRSTAGGVATPRIDLEIVDAAPYETLRVEPPRVEMRGADAAAIGVHARLPSGEWRELNESSGLVLASSDLGVVSVTPERTLVPVAPGTATITAMHGTLSAIATVTVSGETVGVAAAPRKKGVFKRSAKAPAEFVFFSGPAFDPSSIDRATVRVGGVAPAKFKLKDLDKDGVKDLVALVSPRALGLPAGPASVSMTATIADGTRVAGVARALAR